MAAGLQAPNQDVERALTAFEAGHFAEAHEAFTRLLRDYPRDPRVPEWRRQLLLSQRSVDSARGF
jgi:TolA-binding protein